MKEFLFSFGLQVESENNNLKGVKMFLSRSKPRSIMRVVPLIFRHWFS